MFPLCAPCAQFAQGLVVDGEERRKLADTGLGCSQLTVFFAFRTARLLRGLRMLTAVRRRQGAGLARVRLAQTVRRRISCARGDFERLVRNTRKRQNHRGAERAEDFGGVPTTVRSGVTGRLCGGSGPPLRRSRGFGPRAESHVALLGFLWQIGRSRLGHEAGAFEFEAALVHLVVSSCCELSEQGCCRVHCGGPARTSAPTSAVCSGWE